MPARVKGCFHCSRRRINCDRTEPQCLKCIRTNLDCSGLGTMRYRWAKPVKLSTLKGKIRKTTGSKRQGDPGSGCDADTIWVDMAGTSSSPESPREPPVWDLTSAKNTFEEIAHSPFPLTMTPTSHEDIWAINYFAAETSRWMCPTRSSKNEFQTLLSPLALEVPELFSAMAATAYHRLASYGSHEFSVKAERYKSSAISGLLHNARQIWGSPNSRRCQLSAMAVIVVMVYDDMVSAQNYFRVLVPIMKTLLKLVNFSMLETDELGIFLAEQMGLLLVLCLPYFSSADEQKEMAKQALRFLDVFASKRERHPNASFLAFCLRQSVSIWLRNVEEPGVNMDPILEDFKWRLENFSNLLDMDHYLTWVYFNCAAASSNPELRHFFTEHLRAHMIMVGFKNIPLMLELLQRLRGEGRRWPSRVQGHSDYICA